MAFLDFLKPDYNNPFDAARAPLQKIPGLVESLRPQYSQMANQPVDVINQILSSYKPSEGYQFKEQQLNKALGNTAAAGGFAGTENDQQKRGELINALLSQDMQQFLGNVRDVQNQGLEGTRYLADYLGNLYGGESGLAYQAQNQENANNMSFFNALTNLFGTGIGAAFGSPWLGKALGGMVGGQQEMNQNPYQLGMNNFGNPFAGQQSHMGYRY